MTSTSDSSTPYPTGRSFAPPHPELAVCVVVPVRNEAPTLPRLVAALAAQRNLDGRPLDRRRYEVLLLLNNCTDHSAAVAAGFAAAILL